MFPSYLHVWTGVEVSIEEIKQTVNKVFEEHKATIMELRYRTNGRCQLFLLKGSTNFNLINGFI